MTDYLLVIALGAIALGAVAFPFLAGTDRYDDPAELDADIARYREALDAGTVCARCRHANAPDARFCGDCGRALDE
ncbi:MAG: hypothetical protein GWM90_16470 [Gemmatimonadetes bacterium]|nr:zinc ribbon domain-containing protein [Gemmatimonadota bacterium]NIQ55874.1 zinc ribbon domain-containing protein [Gemmatimonadota bacterium]NIU76076.1 hypothetical protein [Gammaproteobacteria bacterium]NIX45634.1 hypothetical protein [Gemmatimonadota bacterium]NIY09922.1 hypothetical protein [Gemmatimonadota bacterium]